MEEKKENWLITGASGFIGIHLTQILNEKFPHIQLYNLVRSKERFDKKQLPGNCVVGDLNSSNLEWITDPQVLPDDLTGVIHLAGLIHTHNCEEFYKVNAQGTLFLIENLKKRYLNKNLKFILVSSLAAYGPIRNDFSMDKPVGDYGKSKLQAEKIMKENLPLHWSWCIFRPPIVIGPKDLALYDLYSLVNSNLDIRCGISGDKRRYHFVCVLDLVSHILSKLEDKNFIQGETVYPFYPKEITFGEMTKQFSTILGKKFLLRFFIPEFLIIFLSKFSKYPFFPRALTRLTPDKVHEILALGWLCPATSSQITYVWDLEKTLKLTIKDYQEYDLLQQRNKYENDQKQSCCPH